MLAATPLTFQNAVEKNQWKGVVLSGDSEHVVGAIANKTEHRVYIWSRLYGKLERILEGEMTWFSGFHDIGFGAQWSRVLSLLCMSGTTSDNKGCCRNTTWGITKYFGTVLTLNT
jgi:metallophosphoesterase superfamily enzyme